MILQEQIIEEINQTPNDKLIEIYDLICYFRLGLTQEKQSQKITVKQRPIGLSTDLNSIGVRSLLYNTSKLYYNMPPCPDR